MLQVPIDKIVPLTAARDTLSKIIADVETGTPMYIFTKNGKPSVAVVSIDYLQKQMGPVRTTPAQATSEPPSPMPPAPPEPAKITFEPHHEPAAEPPTNPTPPPSQPPDASFWGSFPGVQAAQTPASTPSPAPSTPSVPPSKPVDTIKSNNQSAPISSVATPPQAGSTITPQAPNPVSDPDDMDIG